MCIDPCKRNEALREHCYVTQRVCVLIPVNAIQHCYIYEHYGDIRVCVLIQRTQYSTAVLQHGYIYEHYTMPILEDSLLELGQCCIFTKADLSAGYWHVQLDYDSSMLTYELPVV